MSNSEKTTGSKKALWIGFGIVGGVILLALSGFALYKHIEYSGKWYENTTVNDVDVSKMSLGSSKQIILSKQNGYTLTVQGRDGQTLEIDGDAIEYSMSIGDDFDECFKKQHENFVLFAPQGKYEIKYNVTYNKDKLYKIIEKSEMVKGSKEYKLRKPESAYVGFSEIDQKFTVVKEVLGNKIVKENLEKAVEDALGKAETVLNINDGGDSGDASGDGELVKDIYKAPKVTKEDKELNEQMEISNETALRYVVWKLGDGVNEMITPANIANWTKYKDGKIKYNWKKVESWVEKFCLKYKTVGETRKVKMVSSGRTVKVNGGDYGWQLNYDKVLQQTKKILKKSIPEEDMKAFLEDPTEENKKKITISKKVPYLNTAFKLNAEEKTKDWDPDNHVEISLDAQKVYIIRNGKVKYSCKTISGRPTPERSTKKGAYFLKEHERQRVLKGADYETPVTNWVRITWSGTGFHSARWQNWSAWSPNYYKTRGSHGCLNLSIPDSNTVYELTKYKEAVFIY